MIKSNNTYNHPFHMTTPSPWPLISSIMMMNTLIGAIQLSHEFSFNLLIISIFTMILNLIQWWRDVFRESTLQGSHSIYVMKMIQMSMILFIISEIFFFISFFWSFFHMSLSPSIEIGNNWPPIHILTFNPYNTPLLNTIILLSSGISITWSHNSLLNKNFNETLKSTQYTILLGMYFTYLQYSEYLEASFTISDSIYGSTFFMITGFHGIHVIIGTIFICVSNFKLAQSQVSNFHHLSFETSSWYWHFVDIIWLFVYILIYF